LGITNYEKTKKQNVMKNFILINTLLLFWGIASSQSVLNGSLTSTCLENGYNTTTDCVAGWTASHGNPSVYGTIEENTWAWMWSHSKKGEGIITNYTFEAGKTYQISFRIKTSTNVSNPNLIVLNSTANIRAVSTLTAKTGSYDLPTIPKSSELIWSKPIGKNINNWHTINLSFTPIINNSQLWFYPLMTAPANSNGGALIQMEIDDVVITAPNDEIDSEINSTDTGLLSPNPSLAGELIRFATRSEDITQMMIIDYEGNSKSLTHIKINNKQIGFELDDTCKPGNYIIKIIKKNNVIISKKLVVKS
jgi:hypothetical protein